MKRKPCVWREDADEYGVWNTACGKSFCFDGVEQRNFCLNCGKPIKEIPYKEA